MTKNNDTIFYSATLSAWYDSHFMLDKSLLVLSTGGIGLLTAMVTTCFLTIPIVIIYFITVLSFLVCIVCIIGMYPRSCDHLKKLLIDNRATDPVILFCNKIAIGAFISGLIFTLIISLLSITQNFAKQEVYMNKSLKGNNKKIDKMPVGGTPIANPKPKPKTVKTK